MHTYLSEVHHHLPTYLIDSNYYFTLTSININPSLE